MFEEYVIPFAIRANKTKPKEFTFHNYYIILIIKPANKTNLYLNYTISQNI